MQLTTKVYTQIICIFSVVMCTWKDVLPGETCYLIIFKALAVLNNMNKKGAFVAVNLVWAHLYQIHRAVIFQKRISQPEVK